MNKDELQEIADVYGLYTEEDVKIVFPVNCYRLVQELYNAGRDVLMCRTEEKAYDNLSDVINSKDIEQFLRRVSE